MITPPNYDDDPAPTTKRGSIFAHDYPVPVSMVLMGISYLATVVLPFRFPWTINNAIPLMQAYEDHINKPIQATPSHLIILVSLIPAIFFFLLEFTVMRSYPPPSKTAKIIFITSITVTSVLIGLISPLLR